MQSCITLLKSKVNRQLAGFPGSPSIANHKGRCSTPIYVNTPAGRQTYYGSDRASILCALILPPPSLSFSFFCTLPFRLSHSSSECVRVFACPPMVSDKKKRGKKEKRTSTAVRVRVSILVDIGSRRPRGREHDPQSTRTI